MMRVFVYEYLCSGAAADAPGLSTLVTEGRSMLAALAGDLAALPDCTVRVLWDRRLEDPPVGPNILLKFVDNPRQEFESFGSLTEWADRTVLIAPETDGILASCRRMLDRLGATAPMPSASAVELCADKLASCRVLGAGGIQTIPTEVLHASHFDPATGPRVVKPRYGAGATETYRVHSSSDIERLFATGRLRNDGEYVIQPYVSGIPASLAAIIGPDGVPRQVWPLCRQHIGLREDQFFYEGGRLPLRDVRFPGIVTMVDRICRAIPGLQGYVGMDFILPEAGEPLLVEVNPRLTTSYLGYRRIACGNLARQIVSPGTSDSEIDWSAAADVRFQANGEFHQSRTHGDTEEQPIADS